MTASGWRPLSRPNRPAGDSPTLTPTPFMWLARMIATSAVGDGLTTAALASSVFFNISPDAARTRVALALIVTVTPFAIITPLIGPALDRAKGGRRGMLIAGNAGRAVFSFLLIQHITTFWLFPEALAILVLKSGTTIATRAVVPKLVDNETRLVEANSKLALLTAIGNIVGVAVGGASNVLFGPGFVCAIAMVVFAAATIISLRVPRIAVATEPVTAVEKAELSSIGVALAGSAVTVLRGIVGFASFLLAFEMRGGKKGLDLGPHGAAAGAAAALARKANIVGDPAAPKWHFGAVLIVAGVGGLVGSRIAPRLRTRWLEERILQAMLAGLLVGAIFAAWAGALGGALVITLAIGVSAAAGRLAFDSLVQRDAPDANWGRSFARFEMRFQISWVIGALIPTLVRLPERVGFALIAAAAAVGIAAYVVGLRSKSGVTLLARVRSLARARGYALRDRPPPAPPTTVYSPDPTAVFPVDPTANRPVPEPPRRWTARQAPRRARRRSDEPRDQLELFSNANDEPK